MRELWAPSTVSLSYCDIEHKDRFIHVCLSSASCSVHYVVKSCWSGQNFLGIENLSHVPADKERMILLRAEVGPLLFLHNLR